MGEKEAMLAVAFGFVAFSVPLLYQDTKHMWQSPPPAAFPPPPPDYGSYTYPDEDDKDAKFRRACTDGNIADAEELLKEHGPDMVTKAHWHGNTPIFEAARAGQLPMVRWLVEHGASVDKKNEWGDAPVNEAATMGHFDIVWYLAEKGADLKAAHNTDHAGGGHNALILSAVRHRSVDALAKLKEHGVDMDTKHWNGNTALHEAARSGEKDLVEWLLKFGGVNISATNDSGEGPVAEAATMGHFDVLWMLLKAGCDVGAPGSSTLASLVMSAVRHSNTELLDHLQQHVAPPLDVNAIELHGNTPLSEAARNGDSSVVEWLLQHGANVTAHAAHGEAPLHTAAFAGHFEIMWRLFEGGAPLNGTNENGGSVLMSAVYHEDEKEVVRLIANGLDADHSNDRGDTPLSIAASKGARRAWRAAPLPPAGDTPLRTPPALLQAGAPSASQDRLRAQAAPTPPGAPPPPAWRLGAASAARLGLRPTTRSCPALSPPQAMWPSCVCSSPTAPPPACAAGAATRRSCAPRASARRATSRDLPRALISA